MFLSDAVRFVRFQAKLGTDGLDQALKGPDRPKSADTGSDSGIHPGFRGFHSPEIEAPIFRQLYTRHSVPRSSSKFLEVPRNARSKSSKFLEVRSKSHEIPRSPSNFLEVPRNGMGAESDQNRRKVGCGCFGRVFARISSRPDVFGHDGA